MQNNDVMKKVYQKTIRRKLPRTSRAERSRKERSGSFYVLNHCLCELCNRRDEPYGSRASRRMSQPTGSYLKLRIDALDYWESVPGVQSAWKGRILRLLNTLCNFGRALKRQNWEKWIQFLCIVLEILLSLLHYAKKDIVRVVEKCF